MLIREFWKIPFLRLVIPLVAGIVTAEYLNLNQYFFLGLFILSIAFSIAYQPFFDHSISYHRRWIFGTTITIALFGLGAYITLNIKQFDNKLIRSQMFVCMVNNVPKMNQNYIKTELKIKSYQIDNVWYKSHEKIIGTFENDSLASNLEYGDVLILKGNLKEISNAGNPSEFDYKKYLERKHIHFKSFQKAKEWMLLEKDKGNPVFSLSYKLRQRLLDVYLKYGISGEEFGLLAALTLGAVDYLNDDLIEAYSNSGAMHILSVSGLHVGIIMIVLNFLLFFMQKKPYLRIIQAIIIIASVWFFAILTGLSPSVNRASAMITLFILGKQSNKKPSPYNSVAASAFILLVFDPLLIFDVGFQLSYLAVISLIFFYQRIYNLYEPKYRIIDKIWGLTAVSIAAQIGTTILSVFYFHQFPTYALLSNLIVVPASFLIMVLSIALLFFSFIPALAEIIGYILNHIIIFQNLVTKYIDKLPLATIEPISINGIEATVLHIGLILLFVFIVTKNRKLIFAILGVAIIAFGLRDYRYVKNKSTKSFTVYNTSYKSAFSLIDNGNLNLYSDSILYNNKKAINYLTSNIIANEFITRFANQKIEISRNKKQKVADKEILKYLFSVDSLKILYLNTNLSGYSCKNRIKINYIIMSKYTSMDLNSILNLFEFDLLIADATVSKWKQEILKKDCQQLAIPFYNVSESGAFVHRIIR
jgi:competence protein ComEC